MRTVWQLVPSQMWRHYRRAGEKPLPRAHAIHMQKRPTYKNLQMQKIPIICHWHTIRKNQRTRPRKITWEKRLIRLNHSSGTANQHRQQ